MKLLSILLFSGIFVPGSLGDDSDCCPLAKDEWCEEKCYKCTKDDVIALKDEEAAFSDFMDKLYEFDAVETAKNVTDCSTGTPKLVEVEYEVDKWKTRDQLYKTFYPKLSECKKCEKYPTPILYAKCVIPIRQQMAQQIEMIRKFITQELNRLVKEKEDTCNAVLE